MRDFSIGYGIGWVIGKVVRLIFKAIIGLFRLIIGFFKWIFSPKTEY